MSSRPSPRLASLSGRQRVLLVLVLLALPLLLVGVLEAGLRIVGYGTDFPLFVSYDQAPGYLVANPEIGRRYFRHEAGVPTPTGDLFRETKAPDAYRIFVQGASTAAGFPFYHGGAFSRMLEQRLQETFPGREIEVVNVALDATNSHTLLDQAPEIIEQQPDAVLIYAGHNEYYGVLGVASAESVGRSIAVVRTYLALRRFRTVQLLQAAIDHAATFVWRIADRPPPQTRTLMEYLGSKHTVRWGSPRYHTGPRQLARNLDDLLSLYDAAGIPTLIGTLVSNERDQPPFVSQPSEGVDTAAWRRGLERARAALEAGDNGDAITAVDRLLALDSTAADPWFVRGRALDTAGRTAAAREAYVAARDRDALPFRAPSEMNRVIRDVAGRRGATVVEVLDAFAVTSPGGIVGSDLILEHLHPTIEGQFVIADAFYEALRRAGEIGEWTRVVDRAEARRQVPVTAVDSLAGMNVVAHLTSRFPFVRAGTTGDAASRPVPDDEVGSIARAYQEHRLPWVQAQGRLQELYARQGRWEEAAHVNRVVGQEMVQTPQPLLFAAELEWRANRRDQALRDLDAAEARGRTSRGALLRGQITLADGDTAAARNLFQRALSHDPQDRAALALRALRELPSLEAAAGRSAGARETADAHVAVGTADYVLGQYGAARARAERALRLAPEHPDARRLLRRLMGESGG